MKLINRVFVYIILIVVYCLSTYIYFEIGSFLPFKDIFWNAALVFCTINVLVAFLFLKSYPNINLLAAVVIAYSSLFLAFKFAEFYYPPSDAYGISTTIHSNIFFSILFWEIAYQVKKKVVTHNFGHNVKPRNTKRLYYPGLISLILLPVFSIYYFYQNHAFDKLSVMQIVSPTLDDMNSYVWLPDINYMNITLTGNDKDDKVKLAYAQLQVRQLIASKDTTLGIRLRFADSSRYWTLVEAFDLCKIENAKVYGLYENDFWIINPRSRSNNQRIHPM